MSPTNEDLIVTEQLANALIEDPSHNYWAEVKKFRSNQVCSLKVVDGCTDKISIAQLFTHKYRSLCSSVPFDTIEMQDILHERDFCVSDGGLSKADHIINSQDVLAAIGRIGVHKNDGNCGIYTDHFLHAGPNLSVHTAFLFTSMAIHGTVPKEFAASTIIPIPKKHNINVVNSNNFHGITLSSVFCKLFEFRDK
jgi:hypothetical protein